MQGIFLEIEDLIVRQTVIGSEGLKLDAIEPRHTFICAYPEEALTVPVEVVDGIAWQTIIDRIV